MTCILLSLRQGGHSDTDYSIWPGLGATFPDGVEAKAKKGGNYRLEQI